jgi:hypothetical protein
MSCKFGFSINPDTRADRHIWVPPVEAVQLDDPWDVACEGGGD